MKGNGPFHRHAYSDWKLMLINNHMPAHGAALDLPVVVRDWQYNPPTQQFHPIPKSVLPL
jgi:hypothetical protein